MKRYKTVLTCTKNSDIVYIKLLPCCLTFFYYSHFNVWSFRLVIIMTMMMLQILSMLDAHHRVNLPPFRRRSTARLTGCLQS